MPLLIILAGLCRFYILNSMKMKLLDIYQLNIEFGNKYVK